MNDLLRLLPPIRRTRGNRLYTAGGERLLDLWLDDGRGILGERDRATRTQAANAGDKGLTRPYPGLYDGRFTKAIGSTWYQFSVVRLFSSEERTLEAACRVLGYQAPIVDTARSASTPAIGAVSLAIARPFIAMPACFDLAMPRLPCPRPYAPCCLMARKDSQAALALEAETGDILPAQALFAAARGLASLDAAAKDGYAEPLWQKFDRRLGAFFERSGPYLFATVEPSRYEGFFKAALAGGALIAPRHDGVSIVPPDFDDGELLMLASSLERFSRS